MEQNTELENMVIRSSRKCPKSDITDNKTIPINDKNWTKTLFSWKN